MRQHDNGSCDGIESLTEGQRHELLANNVRRDVLAELHGIDQPIPLSDLAKAVLDGQQRGQRRHVSSVEIELHHLHLPKLAQHGLIDYDASNREVRENHVKTNTLEA